MITLIMTEVNRYAFDENMREKTIFTFSFQVTLTFDFWTLNLLS